MTQKPTNTKFLSQIVDLLQSARNKVIRTVNQTMVITYFEIGRMIVEEGQDGKERAEYGKQIIKQLSNALTLEFGKGFSERNIEQMRQFYLVYSKPQTLSADFKNRSTNWVTHDRQRFNFCPTAFFFSHRTSGSFGFARPNPKPIHHPTIGRLPH